MPPLRRPGRPARRPLARAALVALAASLAPRPAQAFLFEEHCTVANAGFRAALAVTARRAPAAGVAGRRLDTVALARLGTGPCRYRARAATTFGDVVALVDFIVSPVDAIGADRSDLALARFMRGEVPWDALARIGRDRFLEADAARRNADHFGQRALAAFALWHRAALDAAAAGELERALLLEGFASHYLQDLHAPGHLRTPRDGLHDALALGIHDHYNRVGVRFVPDDVDALLAFADSAALGTIGTRALADSLRTAAATGWIAYGDGRLAERPVQQLHLALVVAREVADVFETYLAGTRAGHDHFATLTWRGYRTEGMERRGLFPDFIFRTPVAAYPYGHYVEAREVGYPRIDRSPLVAVGTQLFARRDAPARLRASVEVPLSGYAGRVPTDSASEVAVDRNMILVGGDVAMLGGAVHAGPTARLLWYAPELSLQWGFGGGWRFRAAGDGARLGSWHADARGEFGVGVLTFGLALGRDTYPLAGTRRSTAAWTITPTLSVLIPRRR